MQTDASVTLSATVPQVTTIYPPAQQSSNTNSIGRLRPIVYTWLAGQYCAYRFFFTSLAYSILHIYTKNTITKYIADSVKSACRNMGESFQD